MTNLAPLNPEVIAWYATQQSGTNTVRVEAYNQAVKFFENELPTTSNERAWIRSHTCMNDVVQVVQKAQEIYHTKSGRHAKVRKWIDAFATSINRYAAVIDVMVQADPLHAGLPWGATKFVLRGVINHAELVQELSKALTRIGEVLPRVSIELRLYQHCWIQDAVARLYGHILYFLQKAVQWYNSNRFQKATTCRLKYQDTVTEIMRCSSVVDAIANTSSHAELRGVTRALQEQSERLKLSEQNLQNFGIALSQMQIQTDHMMTQILQVANNTYALTHTVKDDTTDMRPRIQDIQLSLIIDTLRPGQLPRDSLRFCGSLARRRPSWRQPSRDTFLIGHQLRKWACSTGSMFMIVRAGPRAETRTKDMVVETTELLRATGVPVFWYISSPGRSSSLPPSQERLLKYLIFQVLTCDPTLSASDPRIGSLQKVQSPHSLAEWASLLGVLLSKTRQCFLVVEAEDLYRQSGCDGQVVQHVLSTLADVYNRVVSEGSVLKILVVTYGVATKLPRSIDQHNVISSSLDPPLPAARRRGMGPAPVFQRGLVGRDCRIGLKSFGDS